MTTVAAPAITPLKALELIKQHGEEYEHDGFTYTTEVDGSPVAEDNLSGEMFFVAGELGDEITETTGWVS